MTRREMLSVSVAGVSAVATPRTRMTIMLDCGAIGVKAGQQQSLAYASRFGFESVGADTNWLAASSADDLKRFLDEMREKHVAWGNAGLPVEFRRGEEEFRKGLGELPARASALKRAGVSRVSTWILPADDSLTFLENLKQHGRRLRECAQILDDNGCRLGLEYVAPKTAWTSKRFTFVHTMKEIKELIAEIGRPNVGFLMDSWHWFTAGDTVADLLTLSAKDVVSVDLNDAPAGVAVDHQVDNMRELPAATGVIPIGDFLNALNRIGCDAPVRCEPFNAALRAMPPEQALQATIAAMRKAFSMIT